MTAAATQLPRKLSSESDKRSAFGAMSDIQDVIKSLPTVELKDVTLLAGDYPIMATTALRNVRGVTAVGCWFVDSDPSLAVYAGGVHWLLGQSEGELQINGFESLTSGVKYRVTLRIEGDR